VSLAAIRRKRIASPMLRDENLDLTINELVRIRGREAGSPAVVKTLPTPKTAPKTTPARKALAKPVPKPRVKAGKVRKAVTPRKAARRR